MRPMATRCMQCSWLNVLPEGDNNISTSRLREYMAVRKNRKIDCSNPWQAIDGRVGPQY